MHPLRASVSAFFVCAVALVAAVAGDFVVEGLSNARVLWQGNFTDRSSLDLLPVFLLAVVALVATLAAWLQRRAFEAGFSTNTLIVSAAAIVSPAEIRRLLFPIYGLQLGVLFAMETLEQLAVYHHLLGGTFWLGGPVLASLTIHAAFTVACTVAVARGLRAIADGVMRVVRGLIARFLGAESLPTPVLRRLEAPPFALELVVIPSRRQRGPPATSVR